MPRRTSHRANSCTDMTPLTNVNGHPYVVIYRNEIAKGTSSTKFFTKMSDAAWNKFFYRHTLQKNAFLLEIIKARKIPKKAGQCRHMVHRLMQLGFLPEELPEWFWKNRAVITGVKKDFASFEQHKNENCARLLIFLAKKGYSGVDPKMAMCLIELRSTIRQTYSERLCTKIRTVLNAKGRDRVVNIKMLDDINYELWEPVEGFEREGKVTQKDIINLRQWSRNYSKYMSACESVAHLF